MDRKLTGIIIGAVFVVSFAAIFGFANAQGSRNGVGAAGVGFVDADNNGICDNAQSGSCPYANQTGSFVDANNDGACDNAANCPMRNANGGCGGSGGCARHSAGFAGGCHQ